MFCTKGSDHLKAKNYNQKIQAYKPSTPESREPELSLQQKDLYREYIKRYKKESDEQLYQYLRDIADELGRIPKKSEVPAFGYIKSRLGSWPRILEKAGIKPVHKKAVELIKLE